MTYKIWVLLWKDLLMRKNYLGLTIIQVFLPIILALIANLCVPYDEKEIQRDSFTLDPLEETLCIPRHNYYGKIIYEPSTPFIDALMKKVACYAGYHRSNVKPGNLQNSSSVFSIAVKFESASIDGNSNLLNYTLYPTNIIWGQLKTLRRGNVFAFPRYSIIPAYYVLELQRAIDINYLHLKNISSNQINFQNMDLFDRNPNVFLVLVHLTFFLAFTTFVPFTVSSTVQEKFTGAKELMLTMGVIRWQLWVAKFLDAMIFLTLTITITVIFLYVPLKEESSLLSISPLVLWSLVMYGLIGVVLFTFFMSCAFEKPMVSLYVTEILWFLSYGLSRIISFMYESPALIKTVLCFFPHVALMEALTILMRFEIYGKNVNLLENLYIGNDGLNLLYILLIMKFNIVLYMILIWYLEEVKPGKYGVAQPYNFCFKRYYWFPKKRLPVKPYVKPVHQSNDYFERIETDLKPGVMIQGVSKVYNSSEKGFVTALDNIHLNFYATEINGVLGHNGAGKTTLFSIITGMTQASGGKLLINGWDVSINTCKARSSLGLCPQEDMLFKHLTVIETLQFFGVVKGLSLKAAKEEARELVKKLKLTEVMHTLASEISGGQKRKVSLGIALIGGSEVLILDEPTSGMDPEIRREIWELLLDIRLSRTIALTTHFMEEADALCDRIAILDHGKVKCHGTPMFLKSKFGKGYILKVVLQSEVEHESKHIKQCVNQDIPSAVCTFQKGQILTFEIPEVEFGDFKNLLMTLEYKLEKKQIKSYDFRLSTLEDVFLRLQGGHEEDVGFDLNDSPDYKKLNTSDDSGLPRVNTYLLPAYQIWALFCKKWIFFLKCYKTFLLFSVLPVLILIMVMFLSVPSRQEILSGAHLTYSLDIYPSSLVFYSNLEDPKKVELFGDLVRSSGSKTERVYDVIEAVEKIFERDFYSYVRKINFGAVFSPDSIDIFHNDFAIHMVPVSLNFIHNFLLKSSYRNSSIVTSVDGKYANKELLLYNRDRSVQKCRISNIPGIIGIQSMFYMLSPLRESIHGAKEIELMITSAFLYWLSHLLFDSLIFFSYVTVLYFGLGFSLQDGLMIDNAGEILLALFAWCSGLILFTYMISTWKKDVAGAFSLDVLFYCIFAFFVPDLVSLKILPEVFQYLHPSSILKIGFSDFCSGKRGHYIYTLLVYDLLLFLYLIATDSQFLCIVFHSVFNKIFRVDYSVPEKKDFNIDVYQEEKTVKNLIDEQRTTRTALVVNGLKRWYFKRYHPSPAVRGVSFVVQKGECFGLLGVNGAGKSSTFKMLAGLIPPSQGSIYARDGRLSFTRRQKYLSSIGYCPQYGGLIPAFTGRELLTFFGRLRGLKEACVKDEVQKWMEKLGLLEYAKEKCGTYSGGNKRKLSTAISVIGNSPLVFLDEPTSGVDPFSRRSMWNVIEDLQKHGQSAVLTSHSMDESEALCSRLAIMVKGGFRCIGDTTTLKYRYGNGYCIQLKLVNGATSKDVADVEEFVSDILRDLPLICTSVEKHLRVLQYEVSFTHSESCNYSPCHKEYCKAYVGKRGLYLSHLIHKLNTVKSEKEIVESFTMSPKSLEEIFINLTRNDETVETRAAGGSKLKSEEE